MSDVTMPRMTYKQDQRSGLIFVSLWALHPLTVLALMKHDHETKESKNPAGTCWEGRERESGKQEVPTEIANTTTRLFCFLGSMVNPKVINFSLAGRRRCAHIGYCPLPPHSVASLHLSSQLLLLCFKSPAPELQRVSMLCWSETRT